MRRAGDATVVVAAVADVELVQAGLRALFDDGREGVVVVDHADPRAWIDIALYDILRIDGTPRNDIAALVGDPRIGRVVGFSWRIEPAMVESALVQGMSGYLSKQLDARGLGSALRRIQAGERVVDPAFLAAASDGQPRPAHYERLTPREVSIVSAIAQGFSNQEIADEMHLSINSVKSYIRNAYRKLGLTRRSQAVAWAVLHGFPSSSAPPETNPDAFAPVRRSSALLG